jgi:hypothetical protein
MARRGPSKTQSVFASLPVFKTADAQVNMNRAVEAAGYIDDKKSAGIRYRDAVIAHPDLSARLCGSFGYRDIKQWNGYVPGYHDPTTPNNAPSSSPHRAILVEIVTEALKRNDDWQDGDDDRLAHVPQHLIRTPWADDQYGPTPGRIQSRIKQILAEDESDN